MYKYIAGILAFILFLIITLINLEQKVSVNLIVYQTPSIPSIIFFYLGIVLGAIMTIPVIVYHNRRSNEKVLKQHMKNESKRLKKQGKKSDTSSIVQGNINANVSSAKKTDEKMET